MATYTFEAGSDEKLQTNAEDALTAFTTLKKADQDNYYRMKKYRRGGPLPPRGFALLEVGYGVSVAYRRMPVDRNQEGGRT